MSAVKENDLTSHYNHVKCRAFSPITDYSNCQFDQNRYRFRWWYPGQVSASVYPMEALSSIKSTIIIKV